MQDEDGDHDDGNPVAAFHGPFVLADVFKYEARTGDLFCYDCLDELMHAQSLHYWEADNGFAHSILE